VLPDLPIEGGLALALVRGAADVAVLSGFGGSLALAWLAPPVLPGLGEDAPPVARRPGAGQAGTIPQSSPLQPGRCSSIL